MQFDPSPDQDLAAATVRMTRLARALLGNAHDAEDVAQEAWTRALQGGATPEDGDAWLNGVAHNVAREHRRAGRRRRHRESASAKPERQSPDRLALDHIEAVHALVQVVRSLPQPYRSALVLQYIVGLEPAGAAEALGVNRATLRSRVHRGLEMVRGELAQRAPDRHKRWQTAIAPLVADAARVTLGGLLVSKVTSMAGVALLLLLFGAASYWMYGEERDDKPDRGGAPERVVARSAVPSPPGLQGADGEVTTPLVPQPAEAKLRTTLRVHVQDGGGSAAEARVYVRGKGAPKSAAMREGLALWEMLLHAPERVTVWATALDGVLSSEVRPVDLEPGATSELTLTLTGRQIRGRVMDQATGKPVSGAIVRVGERGVRRRPKALTDANGQFDVMLKPQSVHKLLDVYHQYYVPGSLVLRGGSETVELWLSPRPRFRGVVHLQDGSPASGANVRVQLLSARSSHPPTRRDDDPWESGTGWVAMGRRGDPDSTQVRVEQVIVADTDGEFDMALFFPGTVRGIVSFPGYAARKLTLGPDAYGAPVEITLNESRMTGGRLRLVREDGTPLRGVLVFVQENLEGLQQRTLLRAKTDRDGFIATATLTEGETTRITLVPDLDDPEGEKPPSSYPFTWVVRHTEEVVTRAKR